jgi:ankyrin repeat protein
MLFKLTTGITSELLKWDKSLATKVDDSNSTPLHYAASARSPNTVRLLLAYENSAVYMADKNGLYPIHIAAKCGRTSVIMELIEQVPDSYELLDKHGRNFLHIAIMNGHEYPTSSIRQNPTVLTMLNARDYQGNTLLHLAVKKGAYHIVRQLIAIKMVCSTIMNRDGLTPVDLCVKKIDQGFIHNMVWIIYRFPIFPFYLAFIIIPNGVH